MREKLEKYGPTYTSYSKRREASMVNVSRTDGTVARICGDPHLELSFRASESHMNALLEDYHEFMGQTALAEQVTVEIPVVGHGVE